MDVRVGGCGVKYTCLFIVVVVVTVATHTHTHFLSLCLIHLVLHLAAVRP